MNTHLHSMKTSNYLLKKRKALKSSRIFKILTRNIEKINKINCTKQLTIYRVYIIPVNYKMKIETLAWSNRHKIR